MARPSRKCSLVLVTMLVAVGCADSAPRSTAAVTTVPHDHAPEGEVDSISPSSPSKRPASGVARAARFAEPRFAFEGSAELLAESPASMADSVFQLPTDLHFAKVGLLVFDIGDLRIRRVRLVPTLSVTSHGRGGRGPGEFSIGMRFQGTRDLPMAFDGRSRRLSRLEHLEDSIPSAPLPGRSLNSSCGLGDETSLASIVANDLEFFNKGGPATSTVEQTDLVAYRGATVLDSMSFPWPELRRVAPMGRQATAQQLDDTTCVLLTAYQAHFAVTSAWGTYRAATYIEPMPLVAPELVRMDGGRSASISVPDHARLGPRDARAWRNDILILFTGRTAQRDRIIDVYRRTDLVYRGSLLLPDKSSRIAVSGDTLAVIAERDDAYLIQLFILSSRRP
jgi:hypothetical protein